MVFFKSTHAAATLLATLPSTFNMGEPTSIQGVAKSLAAGAMSYYPGTAQAFADLPAPYYWWECGALMGAMLDYSHYVGDHQYDRTLATALLAQVGPNHDFMVPKHQGDEGNDDQVFWGFAVMAAAERNFPQPDASVPSWLDLGVNIFNSISARWDTAHCGGGLMWQIFASNPNGLHYKNSVSNGGLFQLAARLARATGNETYSQWADRVWDWTTGVGMIDGEYNVYDGADISDNCTGINHVSFSYSTGVYLHGAAVMANHTGDQKWADRAEKLLTASKSFYGGPENNVTNVMYEHACEHVGTCNTDMKSFKGYLSRFMYQAALLLPALVPGVKELMHASASAAAQACTGGDKSATCGQKWYVGGFDGVVGLGQQMSALETIQGLLAQDAPAPLKGDQIQVVRSFSGGVVTTTAAAVPAPSNTAAASADSGASQTAKRDNAATPLSLDLRLLVLSSATAAFLWGMM